MIFIVLFLTKLVMDGEDGEDTEAGDVAGDMDIGVATDHTMGIDSYFFIDFYTN